jgi:osmotically-inducible protein OsmY
MPLGFTTSKEREMKYVMTRGMVSVGVLLVLVALCCVTEVSAQRASRDGGSLEGGYLRELDLNQAQRKQIRGILSQHREAVEGRVRELREAVLQVLTPDQQADAEAKMKQRRDRIGEHRARQTSNQSDGSHRVERYTRIEAEVREVLSGERDLRDLMVTAAGTEVTLTGEVETFWSKSEAIRRTLDVDGVETLASEIGIPHAENDEVLATEVAKVIQRYPHHTVFDYLDGSVNKGVVTLGGKVTPDRNKSDELFERVAKVPGVQDVQNDIHTMTPSRGDDNLRLAIARQIFRSIHFERFSLQSNPPFHIIVERSVVTLVGYVQGEIELRAMEQIARQTHGVLRVDNQLKTIS